MNDPPCKKVSIKYLQYMPHGSPIRVGDECLWSVQSLIYILLDYAIKHYSGITWASWHSKSLATPLFVQLFVQAGNKGKLCGKYFHVMMVSWSLYIPTQIFVPMQSLYNLKNFCNMILKLYALSWWPISTQYLQIFWYHLHQSCNWNDDLTMMSSVYMYIPYFRDI